MLTINEYRKNPCRALSIPYWKAKVTTLPETMKIPNQFHVTWILDGKPFTWYKLENYAFKIEQ